MEFAQLEDKLLQNVLRQNYLKLYTHSGKCKDMKTSLSGSMSNNVKCSETVMDGSSGLFD